MRASVLLQAAEEHGKFIAQRHDTLTRGVWSEMATGPRRSTATRARPTATRSGEPEARPAPQRGEPWPKRARRQEVPGRQPDAETDDDFDNLNWVPEGSLAGFLGCVLKGGAWERPLKCGGRRPPHFGRVSRASGASQTSNTHPNKSKQEPTTTTSELKQQCDFQL